MTSKKGLLQRLDEGVVIGDGGFTMLLEKRGYMKAGSWTPEAVVERPDAVLNLHREFLDAGSDVMQAYTFHAGEDVKTFGGHKKEGIYTVDNINRAAIKIAQKVANEGDCLVSASITETTTYIKGGGKEKVQQEFRKLVEIFVECGIDFLILEFFDHVEELEWAIEVGKEHNLTIVACMSISTEGDRNTVPTGECAVRLAKAGAHVVGLNCHYDPFMAIKTIKVMKKALDDAGLKVHLITQPVGYHTPDISLKNGYLTLAEFPFAMEPRVLTRFDMKRYARLAYEAGVRYIGGCCGTEAYHIRALYEELEAEHVPRPKPFACTKHEPWGAGLGQSLTTSIRVKNTREFWENLKPATGRPTSASFSLPDDA